MRPAASSSRRAIRVALSIVALSLASFASSPAQAEKPSKASREKAKALFKAGKAAYAAGSFLEAARLFSEGYEIDHHPALLLNIGQSYRSAGKPKEALSAYQKYITEKPDSPLRAQVEDLIRELEAKVKQELAPPLSPTAGPAPAPSIPALPAEEPTPEPPAPRPFYKTWWFWTIVGAAVAGTGAGLGAYYGTRDPGYVKEGGLGAVHW